MKPIIVRGGGDLATGTIHRLCKSGYPVIVLEDTSPSAIRQKVSFCQAAYEGSMEVEGIVCQKADTFSKALEKVTWKNPMLVIDPKAACLNQYHPNILIDAILAKKNLGTHRGMADLTIALGPGFTAGEDVDRNKERALSGKTDREGKRHFQYWCTGHYWRIRKGAGASCSLCRQIQENPGNWGLGQCRRSSRLY